MKKIDSLGMLKRQLKRTRELTRLNSTLNEQETKKLQNLKDRDFKKQFQSIGYPINQDLHLKSFYEWYVNERMGSISMNNVGNPFKSSIFKLNTLDFEVEVIDHFLQIYGFKNGWGFVCFSGTDGNMHGVYFGRKFIQDQTKIQPVLYVSNEAHYSIKKIADVQNMELELIESDEYGRMNVNDLKKKFHYDRPAIVVIALGTTFKGAIDPAEEIMSFVRSNTKNSYFHLDGALFGGYFPFIQDPNSQNLINQSILTYDSISVSGHKFFGSDEPYGIFLTRNEILDHLNPFHVSYLNDKVPTISCSRNSLSVLKSWWGIKTVSKEDNIKITEEILLNAKYLHQQLNNLGIKGWLNPFSNTVYFERPKQYILDKYDLAIDDCKFKGPLAHVIIMPQVHKKIIDEFIAELKENH